MEISSHTERPTVEILIDLIQRMIGVIRYENKFAYALLQQVTANKSTVIDLDGNKIFLQASDTSDYIVCLEKSEASAGIQFTTTFDVLQNIIAGTTTIDKSIADHSLFVQAPFQDLLNMYRLVVCLLAEGPLNPRLRSLWVEFIEKCCRPTAGSINTIEHQKPRFNSLIDNIPQSILLVNI